MIAVTQIKKVSSSIRLIQVLLLIVLGAIGQSAVKAAPASEERVSPTDDFSIQPGATLAIGGINLTVPVGFRGYKKGAKGNDEIYMLVRNGSVQGEYAVLLIEGSISTANSLTSAVQRNAFLYLLLGSAIQSLETEGWTIKERPGMEPNRTFGESKFLYGIAVGGPADKNRNRALANTLVGDDLLSVELQAPPSMWEETLQAMNSVLESVKARR